MPNTFTNFDAPVTSALVFRGFIANSIGAQVANLSWGRAGSAGVYVPTISGVAIADVSTLRGYGNQQTVTAGSVLISFDKHRGSHFVIGNEEQSTTEVDLLESYAETTGANLAA